MRTKKQLLENNVMMAIIWYYNLIIKIENAVMKWQSLYNHEK